MVVKVVSVVQVPWQCRYHIIHIYRYIGDLPYNTISSYLMSQPSDLGSLLKLKEGKCIG
jgi:hypothetical protein